MNRIHLRSLNDKKANVKNPRCLELFLNCCKSKATRETYANHLTAFLKHIEKDHESFLMLSDVERNIILEDYAMFCKNNVRYACSSIREIFSAIEKFLFVNDKTMNKKKLMMFLPEEKRHHKEQLRLKKIVFCCQYLQIHAVKQSFIFLMQQLAVLNLWQISR